MNPWLLVGPGSVVYALYLCFGHGRWSTSSKHFKLYKVLDSSKAPDLSITILKGDFPERPAPGFVTYVRPRIAAKRGLKSRQIVGCLKDFKAAWVPENFSGNKAFKDMIHSIAIRQIPDSVRAKAKTLRTGEVRLIDDRITAPAGGRQRRTLHRILQGGEWCCGPILAERELSVVSAPRAARTRRVDTNGLVFRNRKR